MVKNKLHKFINQNSVFLKFIYSLIILNVLSIILTSYEDIRIEYYQFFKMLEYFSVIIFSLEYVLRIWTSNLDYSKESDFSKRIKFITSKFGLIDLLAILPFYLPMIFPFDLRVVRILRLFRLLRIFKLGRLSKSTKIITNVIKETKIELSITLFIAFILLILSATLMYYFENGAQPEKFKNIGQALWWSVATLTTVGYGDIYPITPIGKLLSAIIALIGIGFVALPTGIISSAFIEKVQAGKAVKINKTKICKCPNCGFEHSDT